MRPERSLARILSATAVIATLVLSGCLSDGSIDPEVDTELVDATAHDAPTWGLGEAWVWDVTQTERGTGRSGSSEESRSETERGQASMTVIDTETPFQGRSVYWMERGEDEESIFDMPGQTLFGFWDLGVIDQETLTLAGNAYGYEGRVYEEESCSPGTNSMRVHPVEDSLPLIKFPVTQGDTWTVDDHDLRTTATVVGQQLVDTPAGTFDAVRINLEVTQRDREDYDDGFYSGDDFMIQSLSFEGAVWYAPSVGHFVKGYEQATMMYAEGDEAYEMSFEATFDLTEHVEATGLGKPLPPIQVDAPTKVYREPMYDVEIVTDTMLPLNIAAEDAPATIKLALAHYRADADWNWDGDVPIVSPDEYLTVDDLVGESSNDAQILWYHENYQTGRPEFLAAGDVLELPADRIQLRNVFASYGVPPDATPDAAPEPTPDTEQGSSEAGVMSDCVVMPRHVFNYRFGWASVVTFLEKSYDVDMPAGVPTTIDLDEMELGRGTELRLETDLDAALGFVGGMDHAYLEVSSEAHEYELYDGSYAYVDRGQQGVYSLVWVSKGAAWASGAAGTGHSGTITFTAWPY